MTGLLLVILTAHVTTAAAPSAPELDEARRWAAARFEGKAEEVPLHPGIRVLANNDPVQMNARDGHPLRLVDVEYTRGLYCHANSRVVVQIAQPGQRFDAVVGVDSNEQTSGGRGSVVFGVELGGTQVWHSEIIREGMPGVPVSIDLGGATEFVLTVDDAGDGIACDQSDWADARVVLDDGTEVWLGDLAQLGPQRSPYAVEPFFSFTCGGKRSSDFLDAWMLERRTERIAGRVTSHTLTYTDPETGLVVRCQ
ncbi:MAG TPA: NPCBM/NEW2 domain-containing protein, partial [Candidatus Hydrogenedentes bacterium]|nr:NPCBM/NEW2 domain-containing protein [Candidatus Hydrogenedentota bacterium]